MVWSAFCALSCWVQVAVVVGLAFLALKIYVKATTGYCHSTRRLDGKTVIITGANTGIGKETALDIAHRGARVILACRNLERANAARDEIVSTTGNKNVHVKYLDLSVLKSVREFAKDILATESRLDILVNNAGLAMLGKQLTQDGMEYQMQSNHFGHFLLTNLLLGLIKKSGRSRIINVSSEAHRFPRKFDLNNLDFKTGGTGVFAIYGVSKLCNVLFTKELASRLAGTGVAVNSLHPGAVKTDFGRFVPKIFIPLLWIAFSGFIKTAKEGAQTSIYLAVSEEVEGLTGKYFSDCKVANESALAKDEGLAKKLWEFSETLVGLQSSELHL